MFIGNSSISSTGSSRPFLSQPLQWTVRVLAWVAFLIASYLAYKSIGHDVMTGCITGSPDCAAVQSSSWSVWLGLPVAIAGLACYSTLAGLSVLTGVTNPRYAPWISTSLTMFALVAAVSGLWFTAIQFFVLHTICFECMAVHVCGIAIASIVMWALFSGDRLRAPAARTAPAGLMALRAATPVASRGTVPVVAAAPVAARSTSAVVPTQVRPSLKISLAGALTVLVALVGGQLLFPADGAVQGQVALDKTFHLDGATDEGAASLNASADGKQTYEVNKIATGESGTDSGVKTASGTQEINDAGKEPSSTGSEKGPVVHAVADIASPKTRVVKLLDGKVSLDVYRHPVLGSPEAPHIVLEFVSYDCPHCHHMAKTVRRALDRYGSEVAVVVLVIPAGIECNKEITDASKSSPGSCSTARMALSVARLEPEKFSKFHDWLMEGEKAPSPAQAVQKAYNAVGRERIQSLKQQESTKDDFVKQVSQNIDLYNAVAAVKPGKKPGLPLVVLGSYTHSGTPPNEEKFIDSWAEHLGVKAERPTTTLVP